jgi:hypothetical protein
MYNPVYMSLAKIRPSSAAVSSTQYVSRIAHRNLTRAEEEGRVDSGHDYILL